MIPFSIDLLRPGEFAHTPFERFLSRQGGKRLAMAYALGGLLILAGGYRYWERTAPLRAALTAERQHLQILQTQIAGRQQDVTQMRNQFQVIGELEKFQVVWSEVLQAVSERMPGSLWLNRIELVQPDTKSTPQAAAGAPPTAKLPQVLRLEIMTELGSGSTPLIDVARFLDALGHDRRFSQRFQLMDWEALSSVTGSGEAHKDQIMLTVSFKVVL
jgi:Tfp pilus assembly protein PilN